MANKVQICFLSLAPPVTTYKIFKSLENWGKMLGKFRNFGCGEEWILMVKMVKILSTFLSGYDRKLNLINQSMIKNYSFPLCNKNRPDELLVFLNRSV